MRFSAPTGDEDRARHLLEADRQSQAATTRRSLPRQRRQGSRSIAMRQDHQAKQAADPGDARDDKAASRKATTKGTGKGEGQGEGKERRGPYGGTTPVGMTGSILAGPRAGYVSENGRQISMSLGATSAVSDVAMWTRTGTTSAPIPDPRSGGISVPAHGALVSSLVAAPATNLDARWSDTHCPLSFEVRHHSALTCGASDRMARRTGQFVI